MSSLPKWLKEGALIVHKQTHWLAEITGFDSAGNPILEFDDTGSVHDDYKLVEVVTNFEPWTEGAEVVDRTGKSRINNPAHPKFLGRR